MKKKKPIAISAGVFDCLHEGHVNLLHRMHKEADEVAIFLHDDYSTFLNKTRFPVQTWQHRKENLLASGLVNAVIRVTQPNPAEEVELFACTFEPEDIVYMRGDDWANWPGRKEIKKLGITIRIIGYTKGVSTTAIRKALR